MMSLSSYRLAGRIMGCLKGEKTPKPKPGLYQCKDCQATAKRKKKLCEPKLIKK